VVRGAPGHPAAYFRNEGTSKSLVCVEVAVRRREGLGPGAGGRAAARAPASPPSGHDAGRARAAGRRPVGRPGGGVRAHGPWPRPSGRSRRR
jgi:hypothetical protein